MRETTVYYNAKVLTVDPNDTVTDAFTVQGDLFGPLGPGRELLDAFGSGRRVDLKGRCVVPGLNDGHAHPSMAGTSELSGEIPVHASAKAILEWVREEAAGQKPGEWIYIHRCFPSRLKERYWPTREELDRAAPRHPVFLNGAWAGMANSRALAESNITAATRHEGVVRDRAGKPNGVLHRSAHGLLKVKTLLSDQVTAVEREKGLCDMLARYNACGITSVTDTLFSLRDWDLFSSIAKKRGLTARMNLNYWQGNPANGREAEERLSGLPFKTGTGNEWLRMGPFKTAVDGGIFTCTAYMLEPWSKAARDIYGSGDVNYRGVRTCTVDGLAEVVEKAMDYGFTFTAHCTGGGASLMLMQAYERVNRTRPVAGKRFQLLHGNFFTPEILSIARDLGVIMDVQGAWFYRDLDGLLDMVGPGPVAHFHPYRTMQDMGIVLCGGSDHMVKNDPDRAINPFNPFIGIYAMTARKTDQGTSFAPEQALTRMEALRAYTVNNACKSGEERIKGSIEPGKLADFTVLEKDYPTCSDEDLLHMKALETVVGGTTVYKRSTS
jgi:predicted amidohydrolase YtcJ